MSANHDGRMSANPDTSTRRDWNAMSDEAFRAEVRACFEAHHPTELRYAPRRLRWSENGDWFRRMAQIGWIAPNWPAEHGGMGLSPAKLLIYYEEQERWGIGRFQDHGILMVGPVLIRFGSEAQRARWLPKILNCEHIWAQGYSEPNAGSDLAALRTEAVLDGGEFVISGQKIWTTLAQDATHMFVLARTDKAAKKQSGISFLLVDLAAPGVRVRPIRDLAGHEEFNEVFFDAVRVPRENLVGGLNEGWNIAKALLGFERIHIGSPKMPQYALGILSRVAELRGLRADPAWRERYTALRMEIEDLADTYARFVEIVKRGEQLPPEVSMLKILATELFQRIADLIIETAGEAGQLHGAIELGGGRVDVLAPFYKARPTSIYGGSNEIQRNILAKNVLHLPG
jgi:alkylation response protein AidB-like acyl-CoA dehydrogenase